jgi:hypothetical protein
MGPEIGPQMPLSPKLHQGEMNWPTKCFSLTPERKERLTRSTGKTISPDFLTLFKNKVSVT